MSTQVKILELRRELAGVKQKGQHLLDIVEKEKRSMNETETKDFDGFMQKAESLSGDIRRYEQMAELEERTGGSDKTPTNPGAASLGMSGKEIRRYSLLKALQAQTEARSGRADAWQKIAPFEWECSQEVAKRFGEAQGFFMPFDVAVGERRDLNTGTATAGGNLVATDLLAASFIDLLRNRLVVQSAGATMLTGLVGNIAIPKQSGGGTAYWVGEGSAPTESQQTIAQVTMTPHTVGAFTDYTRKLFMQSSLDVEQFVRNDLAAILALAIDYAALHGNDSVDANQPDGIASTSGIGSVVGGTNGAAPDWADIVDLETAVAVDNADIGRLAYVTNAKVRGILKKTFVDSGSNAERVWDTRSGNTPLNGYSAIVSNQVSSTLTKGTAEDICSAIFFGNWADLVIGMWGGLDIMVDPYTASTTGTVRVVALQDVDVAVRHPESFAAMLDALAG